MDPRVGAWEPPGPSGAPRPNSQLSTDAQVWQPPGQPQGQPQDQQSAGGDADYLGAARHAEWPAPEPAAHFQDETVAAAAVEMRGGLLVVDSSSGDDGSRGASEQLYGGYQHTELYGAQAEHSYGADDAHGYPSAEHAHEAAIPQQVSQYEAALLQQQQQQQQQQQAQPQQFYGEEPAYDYEYGVGAFVPPSFEHGHALALESPPDGSPSTASDSLESPAIMYSPHGTMYSLPGAGRPTSSSSSSASPLVRSSVELQPPDLHHTRQHDALFQSLSAPPSTAAAPAPMLSVEIGAGLGSTELPQQPVDYIGVVDFECTCDRLRSQRQGTYCSAAAAHCYDSLPDLLLHSSSRPAECASVCL
jgi:hypothetical protein